MGWLAVLTATVLASAVLAPGATARATWERPVRLAPAIGAGTIALDNAGTVFGALTKTPDTVRYWSLARGARRFRIDRSGPRSPLRSAGNARGDRVLVTMSKTAVIVSTARGGGRYGPAVRLRSGPALTLLVPQLSADGRVFVAWERRDETIGYATARAGSRRWSLGRLPVRLTRVVVAFQPAARLLWTWVTAVETDPSRSVSHEEMFVRKARETAPRVTAGTRVMTNELRPLDDHVSLGAAAISTDQRGRQLAVWPSPDGIFVARRGRTGSFGPPRSIPMGGQPSVVDVRQNGRGDAVFLLLSAISDVYALVERDGRILRGPFLVTAVERGHKPVGTTLNAAIDATGRAVMVWQGNERPVTSMGDIWTRSIGRSGVPSAPRRLDNRPSRGPTVVMNDRGDVAAIWMRYSHRTTDGHVVVARGRVR